MEHVASIDRREGCTLFSGGKEIGRLHVLSLVILK
jgi:hypothetical protein